MADDGSREIVLAHRAWAENPPHLISKTPASPSDTRSLLAYWEDDIKRAARRAALLRGGSLDDAEDFEQAARIALARGARRIPERGEAYVRRIIQNAVRGAVRRERRALGPMSDVTVGFDDNISDPRPEQESELVRLVLEWLSLLPARTQQLYELLYVQGYTQREAAQVMSVSQPRVAQLHADLLRRGRAELALMAA